MSLIRTILPLAAAIFVYAGAAHAADLSANDGREFLGLAAMALAGFAFSVRNRKG